MLHDLAARIQDEPARRAELVACYARQTGAPKDRVYRQLRAFGCGSGRKRRADAGATPVPDHELDELAAMMVAGVGKTGKAAMALPEARQVLRSEGTKLGGLSDSRLAALLRQRGLDLATQRRGRESHTEIRTRPNEVHVVDPSSAAIYYLPPSARTRARQRFEADVLGYEPYKNKPGLPAAKARLRVWRYVIVDHASACLRVRYIQQAGETPEALWEHLVYAWDRRHGERGHWHGLPRHVWWDKGSDHAALRDALDSLDIGAWAHAAGNARAAGAVESAHWIVERKFESRLRLQPVESVEELNERVERWCDAYNDNAIEGLDTRLKRPGAPAAARLELWQRVRAEELRAMPEDALDRAAYAPVERKVAGNLTVSYRHPRLPRAARYHVGSIPGVSVGRMVKVVPLLADAGEAAVRVRYAWAGEEYEERVLPRALDEFGHAADGVQPGEWRPQPLTEVERAGSRLRELAGPVKPGEAAFGGRYRALDAAEPAGGARKVIPMPRAGGELLGLADAGRYARRRMGERWDPALFERLAERWPRGASTGELDAWIAELGGEADTG